MILDLKRYGMVVGILTATATLTTVIINASVWAADQRYVRQEALAAEFDRQRLQQLSDLIDDLELRARLGQATPLDKAKLEQLKRKREEILKR